MGNAKRRNVRTGKRWVRAVDLFCGAGGLTRGLEKAGIDVRLGIDIDPDCEYPYAINNRALFLRKSVSDITAPALLDVFEGARFTLVAGCAPCQPFSTYQQKLGPSDDRWHLLRHFGRLVRALKPDLITMENVPNLEKQAVFKGFVSDLRRLGFNVAYGVLNCADYGVPQQRKRLVLLASMLGPIDLPYVARGLLRNGRLWATGSHITIVADEWRRGKSDPARCPGVKGFTDDDWADLNSLLKHARDKNQQ